MVTPSRSQSSGRGEEDNFEWRQAIERRQLASEKQLKALLQETERLREENVVLRIQASTSGPPRRQRSRGQVANSRPEPESIYPGSAGAIPGACNVRPHEPHTPMPRAPCEESSDSTHFLAKRQRDRKSLIGSGGQRSPGSRSLANNPNFRRKHSPHKHQFPHDTRRNSEHAKHLRRNHDIFAWTHSDMKGIHPSISSHKLNVFPAARPVRRLDASTQIDKRLSGMR
ncbi:hypothetical protein CK203_061558 [Vitis vinifera]|uniref:Uncharacterized protein n=1 Tax=Vitis vinifera TaxID=29760 RepID=A0A438FQS5_VITVI|nr:hypothetical protein CK203_061558 [Vitis vinifera]